VRRIFEHFWSNLHTIAVSCRTLCHALAGLPSLSTSGLVGTATDRQELAVPIGAAWMSSQESQHDLWVKGMMTMADFRETGLELGSMPAEAYQDLEYPNDRVSTVLGFKTVHDKAQAVYIPEEHAQALEYILSGPDISRSQRASTRTAATGSATDLVLPRESPTGIGIWRLPPRSTPDRCWV
jgi:hypothetical protein